MSDPMESFHLFITSSKLLALMVFADLLLFSDPALSMVVSQDE